MTPKKDFEALGYYYNKVNEENLLVGPMIFISADGYISDINSEIARREEQSLGNILNKTITELVTTGGIEIETTDLKDFYNKMLQREKDFATHQGEHWTFKNDCMVQTEYIPDNLNEELNRFLEDFKQNLQLLIEGKTMEFLNSFDFSKYPHDLSQIDHQTYSMTKTRTYK